MKEKKRERRRYIRMLFFLIFYEIIVTEITHMHHRNL